MERERQIEIYIDRKIGKYRYIQREIMLER